MKTEKRKISKKKRLVDGSADSSQACGAPARVMIIVPLTEEEKKEDDWNTFCCVIEAGLSYANSTKALSTRGKVCFRLITMTALIGNTMLMAFKVPDYNTFLNFARQN